MTQKELYEYAHKHGSGFRQNNQGIALWENWSFELEKGKVYHEAGCGNGKLCEKLKGMGYVISGSDIARGDYPRTYPFAECEIKDISGVYDCVMSFDVLEHLPTDEIDETLEHLNDIAQEKIILAIANYGGPPEHLTVQDIDWWSQRILENCPDFDWKAKDVIRQGNPVSLFIAHRKEIQ